MEQEKLSNLMKERILLKQLTSINPIYKELFLGRINDIKIEINLNYNRESPTPEVQYPVFCLELSQNIINLAEEHIKEVIFNN